MRTIKNSRQRGGGRGPARTVRHPQHLLPRQLNIALEHRVISDDKCEECFTKSDAERIVLSRGTGALGGAKPDIGDDIGEPTSGADEGSNLTNLIGAPDGWMPPSAPLSFLGYRPNSVDPPEEDINNPAGWSMFTFTPSYHPKTKKYDGHTTPSEELMLSPTMEQEIA